MVDTAPTANRFTVDVHLSRMKLMARLVITLVVWTAGAYWVLVPHRWEGPVIAEFSATHGLHSHDLVGVVVVLVLTLMTWIPWERIVGRH
jgi:hypothetical protein